MKHYDVSLKKFIKNVVCLVMSGILLIAATIAWFASNNRTSVGAVTSSLSSQIQFDFMHHSVGSTYLDDSSALKVRQRDANGNYTVNKSIKNYLLQNCSNWGSSSGTDWNLTDLYPGKYGLFKIQYVSDGSAKKVKIYFNTVTASSDMKSSIYVYMLAQSVPATGDPTDLGTATKTLTQLSAASNTPIDVFSTPISAVASGTTVRIYYVVGMPATNGTASYQHSASVQGETASVSITKVAVETPSN